MKKKLLFIVAALLILTTTGCSLFNKFKERDYFDGTSWKDKYDSQMVFQDNNWYWYELASNHNDNYYAGTYKSYKGATAVVFVGTGELEKYGVTTEKVNKMFNSTNKEENLIIIDVDTTKFLRNGKDQEIKDGKQYYFGFLSEDGFSMSLTNLKTFSTFTFTKE